MSRAKSSVARKRRHKRVLKAAKGFRGRRSKAFSVAKNVLNKSLTYSYRDRRAKKREFRRLWILRINAAARVNGMSYSRFMQGLRSAQIDIDRKVLAELAVSDPQGFAAIAQKAQAALS